MLKITSVTLQVTVVEEYIAAAFTPVKLTSEREVRVVRGGEGR